jgi:hypothetical protein
MREFVRLHASYAQSFMTFRETAAATFVGMSSVAIPVLLTVSDPFLRTVGTLFLDALALVVWAMGQKSLERLIFHQRMLDGLLTQLAPAEREALRQAEAAVVEGMRGTADRGLPHGALAGVLGAIHWVPFRRIWDAYLVVFLLVSVTVIAWSWLPPAVRASVAPR